MTYFNFNSYFTNPKPRIVSDGGGYTAYLHVKENTKFVTDVQTKDNRSTEANGRLSYSIIGGADKNLFTIDRYSGKVYFKNAPDFEKPLDYGRDNRYEVKIKVKDAAGYTDTQLLKIEVKDVAEVDPNPKIVSNGGGSTAHVNVDENSQFVTDVQTVDNRSTEANGRLSYFIHGGEDKSFFSIDKKTGKVSFNFAPDFEKPVDADGDNTYEVGVKVVDGAGYTDTQLLKVKVQDVVEGKPDPDPDPVARRPILEKPLLLATMATIPSEALTPTRCSLVRAATMFYSVAAATTDSMALISSAEVLAKLITLTVKLAEMSSFWGIAMVPST